mmetsp:Transcript_34505/g.55670  ORF Transcript_34505/g.55670 Transcript_34505/m.55670 type:complete len:256 (+) Transcript_34505:105-872(+)
MIAKRSISSCTGSPGRGALAWDPVGMNQTLRSGTALTAPTASASSCIKMPYSESFHFHCVFDFPPFHTWGYATFFFSASTITASALFSIAYLRRKSQHWELACGLSKPASTPITCISLPPVTGCTYTTDWSLPSLANCVMALVSERLRNSSTMLCVPQPTNSRPVSCGKGMWTGVFSSDDVFALVSDASVDKSNLKPEPFSARFASPFSALRLRVVSRSMVEISLLLGSTSTALSSTSMESSHLRSAARATPFRK